MYLIVLTRQLLACDSKQVRTQEHPVETAIETLDTYEIDEITEEKSLSSQLYEITVIFKSFGGSMTAQQVSGSHLRHL